MVRIAPSNREKYFSAVRKIFSDSQRLLERRLCYHPSLPVHHRNSGDLWLEQFRLAELQIFQVPKDDSQAVLFQKPWNALLDTKNPGSTYKVWGYLQSSCISWNLLQAPGFRQSGRENKVEAGSWSRIRQKVESQVPGEAREVWGEAGRASWVRWQTRRNLRKRISIKSLEFQFHLRESLRHEILFTETSITDARAPMSGLFPQAASTSTSSTERKGRKRAKNGFN